MQFPWRDLLLHLSSFKVLIGKPEGKRLFGRPKSKWEDNIKMGLKRKIVEECGLDPLGSCKHGNEFSG
jgi:hypothetical protein